MPFTDKHLRHKLESLQKLTKSFIGYPCNADFSYESLYPFLSMPLNNVGDAFSTSNYQLNTHDFEREVIAYFAHLYGSEDSFWGYVNNGGSEGNLCGLHNARLKYPEGIVYYSRHSHYSIAKAVQITRSHSVEITVQPNGEMDYAVLAAALKLQPQKPAIIMANIGTTMTGAIDNIHLIKTLLAEQGITDYYIHCDGALHGLILPYTHSPKRFTLHDIDSLSISGHKFIGSPIPCGVFLTHQAIIQQHSHYIEYVNIHDATITGSRNAITPLILWKALIAKGHIEWRQLITRCLKNTHYAVEKLNQYGIEAWCNADSSIVIFPKPSQWIVDKWELACYENIAHIVVMGHVDTHMIDLFISDMLADTEDQSQIA